MTEQKLRASYPFKDMVAPGAYFPVELPEDEGEAHRLKNNVRAAATQYAKRHPPIKFETKVTNDKLTSKPVLIVTRIA
jgi:hypothetical protein